jgi:hypothetical protein
MNRRVSGCDAVQLLEEPLHVGGEIQRVGNDDAVERLAEREGLAGLHKKLRAGHAGAGGGELAGGEIDADFAAGADPGQEFARAAADLEHAGFRGMSRL